MFYCAAWIRTTAVLLHHRMERPNALRIQTVLHDMVRKGIGNRRYLVDRMNHLKHGMKMSRVAVKPSLAVMNACYEE